MPVSGQETEQAGAPTQEAAQPSAVPDGFVLVKKEDHDKVHGDLRRTKGELRTMQEQETQRQRDARQADATAAGEYDKALGVEREEKEELRGKLRNATLGDTLTDVIAGKGYTGEQGAALKRLVDRESIEFSGDAPTDASVEAAVNDCIAKFPNMFAKQAAPAADGEDTGEQRPQRRAGPATPVPGKQKPEGYISPEEYASTPWQTRHTEEFQKRAKLSEPFWPQHIHRDDLQTDAS